MTRSGSEPPGAELTRRAALSLLGLGSLAVFAGCTLGAPVSAGPGEPTPTPTPSPTPEPLPVYPSPVRGAGTWSASDGSRMLEESGAHWYYTWKPTSDGLRTPPGVEFVPMIAGREHLNPAALAAAVASGTTLLGFNEPNHAMQAAMSIQEALDAWPMLMDTKLRLGAPAVAGDANIAGGWLEGFMAGVKERGYRVDFLPVHLYGTVDETPVDGVLTSLAENLRALHATYGLPIWVTELACIPWGRLDLLPGAEGQAQFLRDAAATLAALPFVERYAWFSLPFWETAPTISLFDATGARTLVGDTFRQLP